jgi:hypothetical protein
MLAHFVNLHNGDASTQDPMFNLGPSQFGSYGGSCYLFVVPRSGSNSSDATYSCMWDEIGLMPGWVYCLSSAVLKKILFYIVDLRQALFFKKPTSSVITFH